MLPQAAYGFTQAAQQPNVSDWLRKRAELHAGEVFDLMHDHGQAMHWYQLAAAPGGDQSQADAARKYMNSPYTGK
jgi:TPR repeat protein